jgi:hypothetical protein
LVCFLGTVTSLLSCFLGVEWGYVRFQMMLEFWYIFWFSLLLTLGLVDWVGLGIPSVCGVVLQGLRSIYFISFSAKTFMGSSNNIILIVIGRRVILERIL